jgi:hypothetical protein
VNFYGQPIQLATISNVSQSSHCVSDSLGRFTIAANKGDLIVIQHINYQSLELTFNEESLKQKQIKLKKKDYSINEISFRYNKNPEVYKISSGSIEEIPSFLGEQDIVKYISTISGVSSLSLLDAGIYVRGGNSSHNSYLVNHVSISDPQHLSGVLSTFDPYVLVQSQFYKSGYPSLYNGYLSSYINMNPATYTEKRFSGEASLGLLSSSLKFKWKPIKKNNSVLSVSLRRSYFDLITKAYNKSNETSIPAYSFSDVAVSYYIPIKANWKATVFHTSTGDVLPLKMKSLSTYELKWGSNSSVVNIEGKLNRKSKLQLSLGRNTYGSRFDAAATENYKGDIGSENYSVNVFWVRQIKEVLKFKLGAKYQNKEYHFSQTKNLTENTIFNAEQLNTYSEIDWNLPKDFNLIVGGNVSVYRNGRTRAYFSPRFKLAQHRNLASLWFDYSHTLQFEERFTVFTISSPVDVYVPIEALRPSESHHFSCGYSYRGFRNLTFTSGIFYKKLAHMKDFVASNRINVQEALQSMTEGKGQAYGIENDLSYRNSWVYARLNYTWSDVKHHFEEFNDGNAFHPAYHIEHNILLNTSVKLSERIHLNALWSYTSGTRITIPIGVAIAKDIGSNDLDYIPVYRERYNYQLPANHHLDVNIEFRKNYERDYLKFNIGAYNAYNQQNTSFVYVEAKEKDDYYVNFVVKSKVILPFMPYVSLTYYFNE